LKEAPSEAEVPSHIFMVRGGYLRKVAAGVYSFLPLGFRVLQKVEKIIREEMARAGAAEVQLPTTIPWAEACRRIRIAAGLDAGDDRGHRGDAG